MFAKKLVFTLLGVIMTALLGGCGMELAFTPEAAVAGTVSRSQAMPDFTTDPNSVQILQKQPLGKKYMVLVAFKGVRVNSGPENCLFSYEVVKSPVGGWTAGSGGGGCSGAPVDMEAQPIGITGGSGSGEPGDPGYSQVYGEVFNPKVKTIQVSWSDGTVEKVLPVNSTYFTNRVGQLQWNKVEALDEQGNIIYTFETNPTPGKQ